MRLIATPLVAVFALLLSAASADAYRVDMTAFLNGSPYAGEALQVGDLLSVQVALDTEDQAGITLVGVGVLFDESSFTYRRDLSSTSTYLLFTGAPKTPYLIPDPICAATCDIYPTRSNQMQVGFISSGLPAGVPTTTAQDLSVFAPVMHTGIFEVTSTAAGSASFDFDFDPFFGSILQLDPPSNPPLTLGASVVANLPEPTAGLLAFAAIGTVAAVRRLRHAA